MEKTNNKPESSFYMISVETSECFRILKSIFAIMVVFIHNHIVNETDPVVWRLTKDLFSEFIACAAVPGFFVMASILLYRREFSFYDNIKRKIKTLVIPYLIVNVFWIVFYAVSQIIPGLSAFFSDPVRWVRNWNYTDYFNAFLGFRDPGIVYGPLWFVRDLFVLNVIAIPLRCVIDRFPKTVFVVLIAMLVFNISTPLFFLRTDALAFFSLGYYIVKKRIHLEEMNRAPFTMMLVIYLIIEMGTIAAQYFGIRNEDNAYLFTYMTIFSGLLFWMRFVVLLYTEHANSAVFGILRRVSDYTFMVYILHQIPITILQKMLNVILPNQIVYDVMEYFLIPVIMIVICIGLCNILNRFTPKIYLLLSGYRS